MKKIVRLTEQDVNRMVKNAIKQMMYESEESAESKRGNGYMEKYSPLTRFKHDNNGADAMKTLKAIDKGGHLPHNRTASEDADMQRDFVNRQKSKKADAKQRRSSRRSDKAWEKAADSRPLHRKGSLNRTDEYINRAIKESIRRMLNEVSEDGVENYPYGVIGWSQDESDGVFDRSEIIFGDSVDEVPAYPFNAYALTAEGKEISDQWYDDASCGYDLCYGRMKGLAAEIGGTERDLWNYLTSDPSLATEIK